jgi:hypothetical protein
MMNSRERRLCLWSNATRAMPLCEALWSRRGPGPHHVQKDRIGSWEVSGLAVAVAFCAEYGKREERHEKPCHCHSLGPLGL